MMNRKIKSIMVLKGIKQSDIAAQNGVTQGAISLVINGQLLSPHLREAIAKALDTDYEELWGKSE